MRSRLGAGFLEILFITALLLLFGVTTYTLVAVGGGSYNRVMSKRDVNVTVRVALSYLSTQLRQHDEAGAVSVRTLPDGAQCLVLASQTEAGDVYETRIYCDNGYLKESVVLAEEPFDASFGSEITPLRGLTISYADGQGGGRTLLLSVRAGEGDFARENGTAVRLLSPMQSEGGV